MRTETERSRSLTNADITRGLTLRYADMRDADILLQWRNDPATVSNSISQMPVEADQHLAWFEGVMADPESVLMIGEADGTRIGMVRVDLAGADKQSHFSCP